MNDDGLSMVSPELQSERGVAMRSSKRDRRKFARIVRHRIGRRQRQSRPMRVEPLERRDLLAAIAALPYLGFNYVSFTSGELHVTTRWSEQDWPGSDGLSDLQIASVASPDGEGVLRARADIFRDEPEPTDRNRDGEIYVDLR